MTGLVWAKPAGKNCQDEDRFEVYCLVFVVRFVVEFRFESGGSLWRFSLKLDFKPSTLHRLIEDSACLAIFVAGGKPKLIFR
jgi:hypothetical protein